MKILRKEPAKFNFMIGTSGHLYYYRNFVKGYYNYQNNYFKKIIF
jgi:hypothetical protein